MESKKVDSNLALKKLAALGKGDLTDCTFLVGPDNQVQEIRAFKFDLLVASEYFEGLLRSPLTPAGPIRIKQVEPDIFRLVVEFAHTCGQLVSKVNNLEQCLKLAAAADEFLIEELGNWCTEKLGELITVDNVWTVYDQNFLIKYISSVCEKLLSSRTEECLRKPSFRQIGEKSLVEFLNLEKMNIKSEMELVRASLKYIEGREDDRALFRRCALPHLRLLTLSADDDLSKLSPFLDQHEQIILSHKLSRKDPLLLKIDFTEGSILCSNATKRKLPTTGITVDLFPNESIIYSAGKVPLSGFTLTGQTIKWESERFKGSTFFLILRPKSSIRITGLDILGHIDVDLYRDNLLLTMLSVNEAASWRVGTKVNVYVAEQNGKWPEKAAYCLEPNQLFGSWAHFETSIFVAKGGKAKIKVNIEEPCYIRNLLAKDAILINADLICRARHQQYVSDGDNQPYYRCPLKEFTIFKSFSYERVGDVTSSQRAPGLPCKVGSISYTGVLRVA